MIRFACPHCDKSLRAPETRAGSVVKCPVCGEKVTIPNAEAKLPPPEELDDYRVAVPQPRRREEEWEDPEAEERRHQRKRRRHRERRQGLEKVNLGLGFHYARLVLLLVTLIGQLLVGAVAGVAVGNPNLVPVVGVLTVLLLVSAGVQALLGIVGSIFCLAVPTASGARGIILISMVLDVLALPLGVVMFLLDFPDVLGMLMGLVSWILFMVFLSRLAAFVREGVLSQTCMELLWHGLILFLAAPLGLVVVGFGLRFLPCIGPLIFLALLLGYIVYLIKFLFMILEAIGSLRQVIVRYEL